jgi:CheY-like chemotaxis protein
LIGIEATKEIRSKGISTPIIALTAYGTKENMQKCFQAGMNEFLEKPLSPEAINRLFNKYLSAR